MTGSCMYIQAVLLPVRQAPARICLHQAACMFTFASVYQCEVYGCMRVLMHCKTYIVARARNEQIQTSFLRVRSELYHSTSEGASAATCSCAQARLHRRHSLDNVFLHAHMHYSHSMCLRNISLSLLRQIKARALPRTHVMPLPPPPATHLQTGQRPCAHLSMKSLPSGETWGLEGKVTSVACSMISSLRIFSWLHPSPKGRLPYSIWNSTTPVDHTSTCAH